MNSWTEIKRSIKFAIFSVSAGIIEFASFALLNGFTKWDYWLKYLIALILSVLWNFTLNRHFTFHSAGNVPIAMLKVACFYLVFTPVTTILGNYLVETLGWNDMLVTIINMALNLVTEYFYDRYIVYGKTIDTNTLAKKEIYCRDTVRSKTPSRDNAVDHKSDIKKQSVQYRTKVLMRKS